METNRIAQNCQYFDINFIFTEVLNLSMKLLSSIQASGQNLSGKKREQSLNLYTLRFLLTGLFIFSFLPYQGHNPVLFAPLETDFWVSWTHMGWLHSINLILYPHLLPVILVLNIFSKDRGLGHIVDEEDWGKQCNEYHSSICSNKVPHPVPQKPRILLFQPFTANVATEAFLFALDIAGECHL